MIPHKTLGSGISGTVRYVMGEGKRDPATGKVPELAPGAQSRVAWYGGTGFGFPIDSETRLDLGRRVMEWAAQNQASKTKRCRDDCLHLVLAWDPEERPPRVEMEAAAQSVLKSLGMENARAIFAAHSDTAHWHLHLVISRIDPLTGKAFPDSFDTLALSAWALQWEREHGGVRCEARLDRERQQAEPDPEKVLATFLARRETFTAFDLNRELTKAIPAQEARRAFIGAVLSRPEMVRLADPENGQVMRYTTRQTLTAEHIASGSAERLAADATHQVAASVLSGVVERLRADGKVLRDDQMQAWRHATGAAGLAVIAGKAGTGKSFAMGAIASAYEAQGYAVQSLAPTNKVVAALKRDGLEAATLHSMLYRLDRGQVAWTGQTVVMVDEAGMMSTRLMARLLSHAEHAGAKVILIGDDRQLASMERGGMFSYLAARYGAGTLDEITRQHSADQRELARRASRYDFRGALTALDAQGGIVRAETAEDRVARAAELWGQRSAAAPDASLFVITVSNADAQAVNLAIRDIRRRRGDLGPDCQLPTADGLQAFSKGDRILFSGTASTREGRAAGLVNGNAGVIKAIEGHRVTVALDGTRPGEIVSFTVGSDREAGAVDAIRHGYAGTIYKAQGATYDHAIVVDHPMMRASSGYVALTRHRDSVTVVTSADLHQGPISWQSREGGLDVLPQAQRAAAERSYAAWTLENPAAGQRHDLAAYVGYVQTRDASRRAQIPANETAVAAMARDWSRSEDRRAASRFTPLDYYEAPVPERLTPSAVRAAVGAELPGDTIPLAQPHGQASNENRKLRPTPEPTRETRPMLEGPTDDELRKQPERETAYLDHLKTRHERAEAMLTEQRRAQELDDRAKAFQADKEREAEEGRRKQGEQEAAEAREGRNGDIGSAAARYSIAVGQTYDARDPYASLSRAAGSEAAIFHRSQEELKAAAAKETDPDKRQAIELRRKIEGCDYMAITSERLAGIAVTVTGRVDNEYSVKDRQQAAHYRAMAAGLREERGTLLEAVQAKGVTVEVAKDHAADQVTGQAKGQGAAEPRARADAQPPYRTVMPAMASAPASPVPAPVAAEPEPVMPRAAPVPEQGASVVETTASKPVNPPRLTAQVASASFGTVSFKSYDVAMPSSTVPPPQAATSATAPYDVKPTPVPQAKAPDPVASPDRPRATTRRVVEASAADYLAAKAAGIVTRQVSTPTTEATQTKGVTRTVEITDRKAAASGAQQGVVRKETGIDRDQELGHERERGRQR